jgi:nucleotide-binding universal stress UspA family protein
MTAALPDWNASIQSTQQGTEPVESIVLALDGTEDSKTAVPVARTLSDLYSATLHVAYVGDGALDVKDAAVRLHLSAEDARGAVFEQVLGDPTQALTRLVRALSEPLIVMSTNTGRTVDRDHFGSITESLFATRPARTVLLTPESARTPWKLRRILLAHDGTPVSHAATGPAADLARRARAEVIAMHVAARGEERPEAPGSIPAPRYIDQPQHEWPAWAEEFMNRVVAGGAPRSAIHFKLAVAGGQAGSEIAHLAREREVDLVVMAWHGHWDHASCATRVVVRTSGCPVLLVYSDDGTDSGV